MTIQEPPDGALWYGRIAEWLATVSPDATPQAGGVVAHPCAPKCAALVPPSLCGHAARLVLGS